MALTEAGPEPRHRRPLRGRQALVGAVTEGYPPTAVLSATWSARSPACGAGAVAEATWPVGARGEVRLNSAEYKGIPTGWLPAISKAFERLARPLYAGG
jgi:hypothetical protein